jgi:hypothetical protein
MLPPHDPNGLFLISTLAVSQFEQVDRVASQGFSKASDSDFLVVVSVCQGAAQEGG